MFCLSPYEFEGLCLKHIAKTTHLEMTSNNVMLENLSKIVRKSSQNISKIDLEGVLEAAWEPPLCRGDPKTSFLAILAPLGDPIWGPVLAHLGHRFGVFFICLPDCIFDDLGSIWALFLGPFSERFWKLV